MAESCRRCGAEIVTANLMDIDPGIDRAHFALVLPGYRRRQLSATEWRLFAALYRRHGRVVPDVELNLSRRMLKRLGVICADYERISLRPIPLSVRDPSQRTTRRTERCVAPAETAVDEPRVILA